MDDTMAMVAEFHEAYDFHDPAEPPPLDLGRPTQNVLEGVANVLQAASQLLHEESKRTAGTLGDDSAMLMRGHLMVEELAEWLQAAAGGNHVEMLDALCDMRYVADGTALRLGYGQIFPAAFAEVHGSNMSKLEDGKPVTNEAGRVIKGKDYKRPNLAQFLPKWAVW